MQQRTVSRGLALGVLVALFSDCSWPARIAELERQNKEQKGRLDYLADQDLAEKLAGLEHQIDETRREASAAKYCSSEEVRAFMKECESGSNLCAEKGLGNAMAFMDSQIYISFYLRPDEGIKSLHSVRRGQLIGHTDQRFTHPSTRYLILVQPRSDSAEHITEAGKIGDQVWRFLKSEMPLGKYLRILDPRILPCKMKREHVSRYLRKLDKAQKGEPDEGEPRLRVFVFRTDC